MAIYARYWRVLFPRGGLLALIPSWHCDMSDERSVMPPHGRVPCMYYLAMDVSGDMAGTTYRLAPSVKPEEGRGEGEAVPRPRKKPRRHDGSGGRRA
jgi:hypothetical protein